MGNGGKRKKAAFFFFILISLMNCGEAALVAETPRQGREMDATAAAALTARSVFFSFFLCVCVFFSPLSAVCQVSRGPPARWTLTNVARCPASTVPFAKILLIATSATAGQVSRSRVPLISQFTGKPTLDFFFFISLSPPPPDVLPPVSDAAEVSPGRLAVSVTQMC